MCRKRITGSLSQVVSWAARAGVRVNQRSGSRLFEPVSCPETSICFSEPAGCGPFKELNGHLMEKIVPVKLFDHDDLLKPPPRG